VPRSLPSFPGRRTADGSDIRHRFAGDNGSSLPLEQGEGRGSPRTPRAATSDPALSPDGHFLAYAACCPSTPAPSRVLELGRISGRRVPHAVSSGWRWGRLRGPGVGRGPAGVCVYSVPGYLYRVRCAGRQRASRIELPPVCRLPAVSRTLDRLRLHARDRRPRRLEAGGGPPPDALLASSRATKPPVSPTGRESRTSRPLVANRGDLRDRRGRLEPRPADRRRGRQQGSPQWSPDARWIALTRRQDGRFDVFLIDAPGAGAGSPRPVQRATVGAGPGRAVDLLAPTGPGASRCGASRRRAEGPSLSRRRGLPCVESVTAGRCTTSSTGPPTSLCSSDRSTAAREGGSVDEILALTLRFVDEDGLYYFARAEVAGRHLSPVPRCRARKEPPGRPPRRAGGAGARPHRVPDRKTILFTAFKPNNADLMLIENFR